MDLNGNLRPLLDRLAGEIDQVYERVRELPVTPLVTVDELRQRVVAAFDLAQARDPSGLFDDVTRLLRECTLQVTHPRYFGLFNPAVLPSTIIADALVALYNTQVGGWHHGHAACEMERLVLRYLAGSLGFVPDEMSAHFTSGGNEANHTAVIAALAQEFPAWASGGLRAAPSQPTMYLSSEHHHSFEKIARATGLGTQALRPVPADHALRMRGAAAARAIERDLAAGHHPFLLVATAGTTGAGAIDALHELADVARQFRLWFHVDAAWGGSAALIPRLRPLLSGVERADSLTWDAHKWLNVPLGAGMFFTRHHAALERAFGVDTGYIPPTEPGAVDLYKTSMQWSRRFIGLKILFALAEHGRDGIASILDGQARMGDLLRERLHGAGWTIENDSALPLVCFTHPGLNRTREATGDLVRRVLARGRVWISDVWLPDREWVLRACITSFRVDERDIDVLLEELEIVRSGA